MMTKNDERKALEQIKKIVDGLDEDSYVRAAMDGVIEDAESNIEYDFLFSYKERYENVSDKYINLFHKMEETEGVIEDLNNLINLHKKRSITVVEGTMINAALTDYLGYLSEDKADAAECIVKYAEDVESEQFVDAVKAHREVERKYSRAVALIEMINNKIN